MEDATAPLPPGQTVAVRCAAPPETAWALLATPARWPEWSPFVRRVTITRGHEARPPMLTEGQLLVVHGAGGIALRVRVTRFERGRRWDWVVLLPGPWAVHAAHLVEPRPGGCRVRLVRRLAGPAAPLAGPALLATSATAARRSLRRLARLAETASAPQDSRLHAR